MPYDLFDIERYILNSELGSRTINYYSSQGCPFRCGFCADPRVYKRRWTILNPERIVSELLEIKKKYNVDSVIFADSNFFINENHTKEFCRICINGKLKLKFGQVDGRSNILARYGEETWSLMKQAGFVNILNGTESGSQEILNFIQKDATVEDNVKLVKLGKKYGITIVCSTFIGLPTKNIREEFKINVAFIDKLMKITNRNTYYLLTYTPYPGSPLYDLALKNGFVPPKDLEGWAEFELHKVTTPWVDKWYVNIDEQFDIYYFPLLGNQLSKISQQQKGLTGLLYKVVYFFFKPLVKIRWNLKFFGFPLDYYFFRSLIYIKDKFSRVE